MTQEAKIRETDLPPSSSVRPQIAVDRRPGGPRMGRAPRLWAAHVSSLPLDHIILADEANQQIHVLTSGTGQAKAGQHAMATATNLPSLVSLPLDAPPIDLLPMRSPSPAFSRRAKFNQPRRGEAMAALPVHHYRHRFRHEPLVSTADDAEVAEAS